MNATSHKNSTIQQNGFSFVEVLIVVSLMTLLSMLSVGFYARFLNQNAASNTVDEIIGDLRKAQLYAMIGKRNSNWGVAFSSNTLYLYNGNSFATRNTALDETFSINQTATVSGLLDVNFHRMTGTPSASPTITVSTIGTSKTITVNSQGVATR